MLRFLIIISALFFLTSCQTPYKSGYTIHELNMPINYIQQIVSKNLPQGRKSVRKGGRIFTSSFFWPKGMNIKFWEKPKKNSTRRFYAVVTILGDRRPYSLDVVAAEEVKAAPAPGARPKFRHARTNDKVAKAIAEFIKKKLDKGLKDRNVIDDFRVF